MTFWQSFMKISEIIVINLPVHTEKWCLCRIWDLSYACYWKFEQKKPLGNINRYGILGWFFHVS